MQCGCTKQFLPQRSMHCLQKPSVLLVSSTFQFVVWGGSDANNRAASVSLIRSLNGCSCANQCFHAFRPRGLPSICTSAHQWRFIRRRRFWQHVECDACFASIFKEMEVCLRRKDTPCLCVKIQLSFLGNFGETNLQCCAYVCGRDA